MEPYIDLHTHHLKTKENIISVFNLLLHESLDAPARVFSAGLHPWYADQLPPKLLDNTLDRLAKNPQLLSFGETGLDMVCGVPWQLQRDVFEIHLQKSAAYKKPLVIHCVKAWDEIIDMTSRYQVIRILHGYNGSPELTTRLVKAGFWFSVGKAIMNPASKIHSSIRLIPTNALFCETDTSDTPIQLIYKIISSKLHLDEGDLRNIIFGNYSRLKEKINNIAD